MFKAFRIRMAERRLAADRARHAEINRFAMQSFDSGFKLDGVIIITLSNLQGDIAATQELIRQLSGYPPQPVEQK